MQVIRIYMMTMLLLGFYQVCLGCGGRSEYVLGLPLFPHIEIKLPMMDCNLPLDLCSNDNKSLIIDVISSTSDIESSSNGDETQKYIEKVTWNGCIYDCAFFPHSMLSYGGHLVVTTSSKPNKLWGGDGRKCMDQFLYYGDIKSSEFKVNMC
jgi:putative alpha-1,2-mannosidase